jgi:hypothetical protein
MWLQHQAQRILLLATVVGHQTTGLDIVALALPLGSMGNVPAAGGDTFSWDVLQLHSLHLGQPPLPVTHVQRLPALCADRTAASAADRWARLAAALRGITEPGALMRLWAAAGSPP